MNNNNEEIQQTQEILAQEVWPDLAKILETHRGERHVVVIQDFPDPDAISSAFAHKLICANFNIEVDIIYSGKISHQQNIALVRLLGIELTHFEPPLDLKQYQGAVFIDNQGTTSEEIVQALETAAVPTLIIIDHHEQQERLNPKFSDIRRLGATATMYTEYIKQGAIELKPSRKDHVTVATALMHGIITDTNSFIQAGSEDFFAAAFLSRFQDPDLLGQIMSQARSRSVMEIIRLALGNRITVESFSIAGIGYLRAEDRDAIPQAADFLLTEENIHTAIVYGIVRNIDHMETLTGSLRTSRITIDPDGFLKDALGRSDIGHYFGGGKELAGGFEISIGFLSGDSSEEYLDLKWQVYDQQIKQKIFAKLGVNPD